MSNRTDTVLVAVGLILALVIPKTVFGIDLELVGWILVFVGALALVHTLMLAALQNRHPKERVDIRTYEHDDRDDDRDIDDRDNDRQFDEPSRHTARARRFNRHDDERDETPAEMDTQIIDQRPRRPRSTPEAGVDTTAIDLREDALDD